MDNSNQMPDISEKHDIILAKLMQVKSEMGISVKKDSENPFHKSKYASLGAHLELTEPVLFKHGLLMRHTPIVINNQSMLVTTLHHIESGQWIKSYLPLPNLKGDSQGVGASVTYMRRYSISTMFGLNAEDDDGETAAGRGKYDKQTAKENKKAESKEVTKPLDVEKISKEQVVALNDIVKNLDEKSYKSFLDLIKEKFNASSMQDIPKNAYDKCVTSLNAKIKYLKDQQRFVA